LATGYQNSSGVDLDSLLAVRVNPQVCANTGFLVGTQDIADRYEKVASGSQIASNTGLQISSGADVKTLFAGAGTTVQDGVFYYSLNAPTFYFATSTDDESGVYSSDAYFNGVFITTTAGIQTSISYGGNLYTRGTLQLTTGGGGTPTVQYYQVKRN